MKYNLYLCLFCFVVTNITGGHNCTMNMKLYIPPPPSLRYTSRKSFEIVSRNILSPERHSVHRREDGYNTYITFIDCRCGYIKDTIVVFINIQTGGLIGINLFSVGIDVTKVVQGVNYPISIRIL